MKTLATLLSFCATLAACGGGGGGAPSSNTNSKSVALSAQNYDVAATEVMASSVAVSASSGITESFIGADVQTPLPFTHFVQSHLTQLIKNWRSSPTVLVGAELTESIPCSSGTLSITYNDLLGNEVPDAGDYLTLSANNCSLYGSKLNGEMTITFNRYTETSFTDFEAFVTAKSSQFVSETNGVATSSNGSFDMNLSAKMVLNSNGSNQLLTDLKMDIASMTYNITSAGSTKVYEYKNYVLRNTTYNNQVSQSINGSINIPTLGANTATIETIKNFVSPAISSPGSRLPYPTDGIALVTFKQGGTIRATANGTSSALVELDQDGDGKFETSKPVPWSDIL
ncbi:hypothetical protein [Limnohabitans sp. 63ED37-2]|uniref:hypothetical protein n=1 Tax=Limnohabitans sp. 63ED37-2 TaxID=1678128 RepID=UPI000706D3A5|nr:hypothetical protein [Limnohabitans sp. 63ED37-2]ALK87390.1 hypothetical protein L63ED372_00161 [Limnohabitans sp. 63ED37-2]